MQTCFRTRHVLSSPSFSFTRVGPKFRNLSTTANPSITWPQYFEIRRAKRKWEIATTIPTSLLGLFIGGAYFGSIESDPGSTLFGIEPIYVYGFATVGCMGLGYLIGPFLGSSLWRLTHRNALARIEAKDRQFHDHIIRHRVDPTRQSATNLVPDYYGEKIGSMKDYRRWLRDQAKFRRKATWPEE